ncbi:MAG: hypothetical protein Q9174_004021 [Haloplaca sp. 1 TL-2023]
MPQELDLDRQSEDHHHQGGYDENQDPSQEPGPDDSFSSELRDTVGPLISDQLEDDDASDIWEGLSESYDTDLNPADIHHLLLPVDDPLLHSNFDDAELHSNSSESSSINSVPARYHSRRRRDLYVARDNDGYSDDDDTEDLSFTDDPRFIDSGWGGDCLREVEDIDFEFVYALHTFVATVEGQANATKVKDSSIGYLPAEHIETPTERLARLNKHRNIDLSRGWVTDNQAKSRNPLMKAIRRHNVSKVQFRPDDSLNEYNAAPNVDYSTEEEEEEEEGEGEYAQDEEDGAEQQEVQASDKDEIVAVEPLKAGPRNIDTINGSQGQNTQRANDTGPYSGVEKARTSDEMFESQDDGTSNISRKGTPRNTDSFFKDDNTETKKINLTPSLLRDDSSGSTVRSVEAKELRNRPSIDSLEKNPSSPEKSKDDRRRKEKKGMLSGFFKRKDKKGRNVEESTDDNEKISDENLRQSTSPQPSQSFDEGQAARRGTQAQPQPQPQPQRQISKLQKSPPSKVSPKGSIDRGQSASIRTVMAEPEVSANPPQSQSPPKLNMDFESAPLTGPESGQARETAPASMRMISPDASHEDSTETHLPKESRRGMFSPIRDALRSTPASSEAKPEKATRAKHRMPIDDFDSSSDTDEQIEPSSVSRHRSPSPEQAEVAKERLSESPVNVSPQMHPQSQHPPALMMDTSSQEEPSTSPVSPLSSVEMVEAPNESGIREETPASTAQSSIRTPTWSDARLRAYLEDTDDIKDLLAIVHQKPDVPPVPRDHPAIRDLFKDERRALAEMSTELDGLLGDFLARKAKKDSQKDSR